MTKKQNESKYGPLESVVVASMAGSSWIEPSDSAAIELARTYARRIDKASAEFESGDLSSTDYNKVLYLGPHLLNTLKALGGAPEERAKLVEALKPTTEEVDEVSAIRNKRRKRAAG